MSSEALIFKYALPLIPFVAVWVFYRWLPTILGIEAGTCKRERSTHVAVEALVAVKHPMYALMALGAVHSYLSTFEITFDADVPALSSKVIAMLVATIMVFRATAVMQSGMEDVYQHDPREGASGDAPRRITAFSALMRACRGFWVLLVLAFLLDYYGLPVKSVLAVGGVGSIIIGFAAKDLISDVLSGFTLFVDKNISIGDWVKVEQHGIEGTVELIGWRTSTIRDFSSRPIYIPNKDLSASIVSNVSRRQSMRFREVLSVEMAGMPKISLICQQIKEQILLSHEEIDPEKPIIVAIDNLDSAVCNILISAHTLNVDTVEFFEIKNDIWLKIYTILRDNQIEVVTNIERALKAK